MLQLVRTAILAGATLTTIGCTTVDQRQVSTGLEDTEWVLIGFQDGGPDTELTEVPLYKYTMHLDADGNARFQFDCNRGSSSWNAGRQKQGEGTLSFGTFAMTSMLCPGDSLGETVAADMGRVVRYSIYDGKLSLLRAGDGRIYLWDAVD